MGWKIIEINSAERLRLFLDNLIIYKDDKKIIIPINDIDTLLIDNTQINLSIKLMNKLSEYNINTIICNEKHLPSTLILPISGNYNSLKILKEQLDWNNTFKSNLWTKIIIQKIKNQLTILKIFDCINSDQELEFEKLINDIKPFDVSNREGHAAKIYWHYLFGVDFNRKDEDDIINKYLNYGYAILLSYVSRSILKKGLDLRISIFHKSFDNHYALACDLMEVFRIIIDYEVIKIIKNDLENTTWYESKQQLIECFNKKIKINGEKQFINNAIDIFIDAIVKQSDFPKIEFIEENDWN